MPPHASAFEGTLAILMLHVDQSALQMRSVQQTRLVKTSNVLIHVQDFVALMLAAELLTMLPLAHAIRDMLGIHSDLANLDRKVSQFLFYVFHDFISNF